MPAFFFDVTHMNTSIRDITAPGGIKYSLIIVDYRTGFTYTLPLKTCRSNAIIQALKHLQHMAGKLPLGLFTDFDLKLLCETVANNCAEHKYI